MLSKLRPPDLVAIMVICTCGILLGMGKDSVVSYTLLTVVAGYYGIDVSPLGAILRRKNRKGGK